MLFSVALCIAGNLLFSVNDLLGPGVLFAFAAGRYHHPRREERMLLFIDMRSSTAIAERLGEARFLDFLNRFIFDVSIAIAEAGGEIHKYVGDEVIATWPLAPGRTKPAASAPVSPRSNASPRAAPITSANSACAPISAPGCIAVRWSSANSVISRRRSR